MIEVFKTNVSINHQAIGLIHLIQSTFKGYKANFDLHDCDRILRVENTEGLIDALEVIKLLNRLGFYIEVLPDELPVYSLNYCLTNN
ncbi:hypothetical protein NF867_10660 [Solitalea sp. MAHUQ-68]|uniref:Uncharacterized protein n=2 Tax=Sphingobacteriaceae TaxID=84566 RepID=A0A9X2F283_9SPHI|nr:hypothetical protein [Solitalea agri]